MEVDQAKLEETKKEAEKFYKTIGEIYCPYFKNKVAFNVKGLDHIKLKEWNKARSAVDQYIRLKLLRLTPSVLKESYTLQEFYETSKFERQKINSRWEQRLVRVSYHGFVAIVNGTRIKIIIKQVEGGTRFFWSIIPFWKSKKDDFSNKIRKILHEGDLETQ